MTQEDRPARWARSILRLLREAVADEYLDPQTCRMLIFGLDSSWSRIEAWSETTWDYELSPEDARPYVETFLPLFSLGVPEILEAADLLDAQKESDLPGGGSLAWFGLTDESRPRYSVALGELLSRAGEDLREALGLVARNPFLRDFSAMPAILEHGRTPALQKSAVRLLFFADHPGDTPLLPFLEQRAGKPGRKPHRIRGWAARTPAGIRLFYPEGEFPELNPRAYRPSRVHFAWEELEGISVDAGPLFPEGRVRFRVRGEPVERVFVPRPPVHPDGGNPAELLRALSGPSVPLPDLPSWPADQQNPGRIVWPAGAAAVPEPDLAALGAALSGWVQREIEFMLRFKPTFKIGSVVLGESLGSVSLWLGAPESFAASVVPWRGCLGWDYPHILDSGAVYLQECYVSGVRGADVTSDKDPEFQFGTPLALALSAALDHPDCRRRLLGGLLDRLLGLAVFRRIASGRVYLAIEPWGLVRTLRDDARPWTPFRLPLADRRPFQNQLVQGYSHFPLEAKTQARRDPSHFKWAVEYAMLKVPAALDVLTTLTKIRHRRPESVELRMRIERDLLSSDFKTQWTLIEMAGRALSTDDDPAIERFMLDFATSGASSELRRFTVASIMAASQARRDPIALPLGYARDLRRVFGTAGRALATLIPAMGRLKGTREEMGWEEAWVLNLLSPPTREVAEELLSVPEEAWRLIRAILDRFVTVTTPEVEWAPPLMDLVKHLLHSPLARPAWREEVRPLLEKVREAHQGEEKAYDFYFLLRRIKDALEPGGLRPQDHYGYSL